MRSYTVKPTLIRSWNVIFVWILSLTMKPAVNVKMVLFMPNHFGNALNAFPRTYNSN